MWAGNDCRKPLSSSETAETKERIVMGLESQKDFTRLLYQGPYTEGRGPGDGTHCEEVPHLGALTNGG